MNETSIAAAVTEAKRFLKRVKEWKAAQGTHTHSGHTFSNYTPKESGAIRRASLDLTRALAAMRRY